MVELDSSTLGPMLIWIYKVKSVSAFSHSLPPTSATQILPKQTRRREV